MTIIFSVRISGHHLEYMHHIYDACRRKPEANFAFVLPEEFIRVKDKFEWPRADNIRFDLIPGKDLDFIDKTSLLRKSYHTCTLLKRYIDKYDAEKVYDNNIIGLLPFAPFVLGRNVELYGIIYTIYLYRWRISSLQQKLQDVLKYLIIARSKSFAKVFILNDSSSPQYLNRLYGTTKFDSIADPYIPVRSDSTDIRELFHIDKGKTIFSHFGAIDLNKGTLEILESLKSLPEGITRKSSFLFVGRVEPSFRDVFYDEIGKIKDRVDIRVLDEFCPYETIAALCEQSDALLTPYRRTSCSSGTLGYASQFHTPVVAPDKGLLGKLVRRYKLGILLDEVSDEALHSAYDRIISQKFEAPSGKYLDSHTVESFQEKLIRTITGKIC